VSQERSSLRAIVRGQVQGVGFRAFVQKRARELGLQGYARNRSDGRSVEVVAEGSRPALEALLAGLKIGPSAAQVESVDAAWGEASGRYQSFTAG
jgi:acylphosphatase